MSRSAQSHSWLCPFNTKRCTKTFQVHLPYNSKNLFVFHLYPRFAPKTIFLVSYNKSSSFWYRILFSVYTHILELSGKNADSTLWKSYRSGCVSEDLNRESKAITLYLIKVQSAYVLKFKKNTNEYSYSFRSAIIWIGGKTKLLGNPSQMNVLGFIDSFLQVGKLNTFYHSMQIFLFIGRKPTTWAANNCLQIMVCSWLQIIFCSCTNENTLFSFLPSLLRQKWQIASLPEDIH